MDVIAGQELMAETAGQLGGHSQWLAIDRIKVGEYRRRSTEKKRKEGETEKKTILPATTSGIRKKEEDWGR